MSASFAPTGYRLQWQDFSNWRSNQPAPVIHSKDYNTLEEAQAGKAELRKSAGPDSELVACINPLPPPETRPTKKQAKRRKTSK